MITKALTPRFFALSDPGLARENNEDAALFDAASGLAVLADGMGGYNAGEVASEMATSLIQSEMGRWLAQAGPATTAAEICRAVEICVSKVNAAIYREAKAHNHYAGMGTTLVVAIFRGPALVVGHIGDSRCYRYRRGRLTRITKDHSLLQEQIDAGLLTQEQAAFSINKNLVTRALGVDDAVLLEVHEHAVEPGDVYLLCSDGLSDMVSDQDIERVIQMSEGPEQCAHTLIDMANAQGGRDNITVLLAQVQTKTEKRGLLARMLGK